VRGEQHLRPREQGEQGTSAVELLFDLVYVFAVTQLSHLLIGQLTLAGAGRTLFLLGVVWWAWIYTTWMVNWYDPASTAVRLVLVAGGLASLLMAAAIPGAFGTDGALFAGAYVALQVGRNLAAAALLERSHALRRTYERILAWSALSGALWIAGGLGPAHLRFAFWGPALAVDLIAPALGYRTPGLGASSTSDYPVEGGHFAERFQAFIIIALGESIVVTGATASARGLSSGVVWSLGVAFLGTSALWWLYFGEVAEHSRRQLARADDAGSLARDAYTYLHLPIVAGIIAVAVGNDILISHPHRVLSPRAVPVRREHVSSAHDRLRQPKAHRHRHRPVRSRHARRNRPGHRRLSCRGRGAQRARHLGVDGHRRRRARRLLSPAWRPAGARPAACWPPRAALDSPDRDRSRPLRALHPLRAARGPPGRRRGLRLRGAAAPPRAARPARGGVGQRAARGGDHRKL
jgi:low temperature requirement protein LtrA